MRNLSVGILVLLALMVIGFASSANALPIRVSQESAAGSGDFDANVLGVIDSFTTGLSTSDFYQYGSPYVSSYNGDELNGGPVPISNRTQLFFVEASDGLSFVVLHDKPEDGYGGKTQTRWNLTGDTAAEVLADDPGGSEQLTVNPGGTQFDSIKEWAACCTDGYAIGSLDGDWSLVGGFVFGDEWEESEQKGIDSWAAVSADFSSVGLVLSDKSRRVRFDVAPVPEPATMLLLGVGIVGLAGFGRKKFKR